MKIGIVFRSAPHGTSLGREGLDALLASSAFCDEDEIGIFFLQDGVFHLLPAQQAEIIGQKDFISSLKLLDLYELEQRFVCLDSLKQRHLSDAPFFLSVEKCSRAEILAHIQQCEKVLTF